MIVRGPPCSEDLRALRAANVGESKVNAPLVERAQKRPQQSVAPGDSMAFCEIQTLSVEHGWKASRLLPTGETLSRLALGPTVTSAPSILETSPDSTISQSVSTTLQKAKSQVHVGNQSTMPPKKTTLDDTCWIQPDKTCQIVDNYPATGVLRGPSEQHLDVRKNPNTVAPWALLPSLTPRQDLEATSTPSTETTLSDDGILPVHFASLHGWFHAVDKLRPPLQQPNLFQQFQDFREEVRSELQAQSQRIEGYIVNNKNADEVVFAERNFFSDQLSTVRKEGVQALSLLRVQIESHTSDLDALRADLKNRIAAVQTMMMSKVEHQVKEEMPKHLDHCFSYETLQRLEKQITTKLLGHVDKALAREAAARQQLERTSMRRFDSLLKPVQDKSRNKQKPRALDDKEGVVEQAFAQYTAEKEVKNDILTSTTKTADACQPDSATSLPVGSSVSSSRGASTLGMFVQKGYEEIDETTVVPADVFESLAMAGRVARNRGQHCRTRCGGKQRLIAAELCLNDGSKFARPKCTAT